MKSIIIRGPLGVGKSTVARAVAEKIGGVYVSVDKVLDQNGLDRAVEGEGIPLPTFSKQTRLLQQKPNKRMIMENRLLSMETFTTRSKLISSLISLERM